MANIAFYLLNTPSHFNATFKIARALREKGHNVIYLGGKNSYPLVKANGFNLVEFSIQDYCINNRSTKEKEYDLKTTRGKWELYMQNLKLYRENFSKGGYFKAICEQLKPDLIILDVSKIQFYPELFHKQIPFIVLTTKVCLDIAPFTPPFTSGYIPRRHNFISKLLIEFQWKNYFIKKWIKDARIILKNNGFLLDKLPYYYSAQQKIDITRIINHERCGHYGLKEVPEMILSNRHFDFPREYKNNQFFIGPTIDINRQAEFKFNFDASSENNEVIYCALGCYDFKYREVRKKFIQKIIAIFSNRPDKIIYISTGIDINPSIFKNVSTNIILAPKMPQVDILKKSKLMISHAGLQSINECMVLGVPMLVYPLIPDLDHKGNAARVVYHNIGIRGNIRRDSIKQIEKDIDKVLSDKKIHESCKKMQEAILSCKDFENGIEKIEKYITEKTIK